MAIQELAAVVIALLLGFLAHRGYEILQRRGVIQHHRSLQVAIITLAASLPIVWVLLNSSNTLFRQTSITSSVSGSPTPSGLATRSSFDIASPSSKAPQHSEEATATSTRRPENAPTVLAPTRTPTETPSDPIEFVQAYFDTINKGDYTTAFSWLSDSFKQAHHCCNADGSYRLQPYIDWWENFSRIDIEKINLREQQSDTAIVYVYLRYYRQDGSTIDDQNFVHLTKERGEWRISDWRG